MFQVEEILLNVIVSNRLQIDRLVVLNQSVLKRLVVKRTMRKIELVAIWDYLVVG